MTSQAQNQTRPARPDAAPMTLPRTQKLLAALGVSGAWIANLTQLAPYQPYFIAATVGCLAGGYGLLYRSRRRACADGEVCAQPLSNRIVTGGLILATILVIGALALD